MMKIKPLSPRLLCTKCNPRELNFKTTQELAELTEPVGQERAVAAIEFGIHIQQNGYNLYLLGPQGTGKHHLINSILKVQARSEPAPDDWCYVNNFKHPEQPLALQLPAGMGPVLQKDLADLVAQWRGGAALEPLIEALQGKYSALPAVTGYLTAVQANIMTHSQNVSVNVLVTHAPGAGAPIIYENNPTYANLMGRVEYMSQYGALTTDFTLIHAGALHRANGGYLILDAQQVVNQPDAWEALKRALSAQAIVVESVGSSGTPPTVFLQPEAIPLRAKIILLGERPLYYSLYEQDAYFRDLFKVAADFSNHIPRTPKNYRLFSRLIATIIHKKKLLPLNRNAVAKMIDQSSRLAHDSQRLFTHMRCLVDLLRESTYWAQQGHRRLVKAADVQQAIDEQIYRANRIETRIQEDFRRNIVLVDTHGKKTGQVNALSVLQVGNYSFGSPNRITATVRLGKGEVIDIEREVELGGALHSKGVFILSGYLSGRYLVNHHLSISASLVFEQNYGEVEGDSASAAELAALLSAIARLPVKQSLAITGSVNQYGQIQPIGNVNEKIEGFFSVCRIKGLAHQQGVIIPAINVQHLMLSDEVVAAAKQKTFFIYAVETIDEVMTLLTGLPSGKANKKGHFPPDTVNGHIEKNLLTFAEQADGDHKTDSD